MPKLNSGKGCISGYSVRNAILITGIVFFLLPVSLIAQQAKRPNFIFILADDLGWSSLATSMDQQLTNAKSDFHETPNLDRLVKRGLRFSRGYAPDPICTPTRRSIQFGQSSVRQGDDSFSEKIKNPEFVGASLVHQLKRTDSHYRAAHFGKWDLRTGVTPKQLGYDESDGDTGNKDGDMVSNKEVKWSQVYVSENPKQADSITARAVRFMQHAVADEQPFYLQVSHYATHVNFETKQKSLDYFNNKEKGKIHENAAWAGMLKDLDAGIGQLLGMLDSLNITENTFIFFMADNGGVEFIPPVSNRLDHPTKFKSPMRNYPLRGGKWTLYEGGIRVPFVVAGPGILPDSHTDIPVSGLDILPTIIQLARGLPDVKSALDGKNIADLLFNRDVHHSEKWNRNIYFHRYNNTYPHSAIISGNFKLIQFWKSNEVELYDLRKDAGELNNIALQNVTRVRSMQKELKEYALKVNSEIIKWFR